MGEKPEASAGSGVGDASASESTDGDAPEETEDREESEATDGAADSDSGGDVDPESEGDVDSESDGGPESETLDGAESGADGGESDATGENDPGVGDRPAPGTARPDGRIRREEFGRSGSGSRRSGIPPSGRPGAVGEDDGVADPDDARSDAATDPELVASEFVAPNPDAVDAAASIAARSDDANAAPYASAADAGGSAGDSLGAPEAVAEDPEVRDPYEPTDADPGDASDGAYRDGFSYDPEEEEGLAGVESDGEFADPDELEPEEPDDEFGGIEDDGLLNDGPESDQEMPLADHIEEMVRRLAVVFVIGIGATILVFPLADQLINMLWNTHIPGAPANPDRRPRLYGPLELILTELKVAGLAGFIVGLPVFVYQTYRFMRPGLYPRERRYYLAAVPTSLVLALIGVAFSHFVVLPAIFAYFTSYTEGTAVVAFGLKETFRLILLLMGYMALVFQIPLFIMLAIMMGLVTRRWLVEKRLLFWGGFAGVSFLISPDPTGMAPIIIAATMIGLFEGTLALLRWTGN